MRPAGILAEIFQALTIRGRPDVLIVVPPFGSVDRPSLGVHILQAMARKAGFHVSVLYANLLLACEIGIEPYMAICHAPTADLLGERFFTVPAFKREPTGLPSFGQRNTHKRVAHNDLGFSFADFEAMRRRAPDWCDEIALAISQHRLGIVGFTTTFEQTSASVALLNRIKQVSPETVTIIGGANCEGEMANGIASLSTSIDHIFSGESEISFLDFLRRILAGGRVPKIIEGAPNVSLNDLITPEFDDYYSQLQIALPGSGLAKGEAMWLPYESSRGCWWGQKHHCTFCGINGQGMAFRQKSPDRVIQELKTLMAKHPSNRVLMVDNIMPHTYFQELLPRLADELPGLHIFYEQKANLTLEKLWSLKRAGVAVIQPGIEALSMPLLRLMKKGVTAAQNIAMLRYASALDLAVNWNLLYAFPNDEVEWYAATTSILPYLRHLQPPSGLYHLSIDRFSPYYDQPALFGLRNVRPGPAYHDVFPDGADIGKLGYHFWADYPSGSLTDVETIEKLAAEVARWLSSWEAKEVPKLLVSRLAPEEYILFDTRGVPGNNVIEFIDAEHAAAALLGFRSGMHIHPTLMEWALDTKVCLELDGRAIPLAVSTPEILRALEREVHDETPT